MNQRFLPWIRLWWLWIPSIVLFFLSAGVLSWELASPKSRQSVLETQSRDLQATIVNLEKTNENALKERIQASMTSEKLQQIYEDLFGSLDHRMTSVLRAIGGAARDAGMLPSGFSYSIQDDKKSGSMRFQTSFSVEGDYQQVKQLLSSLQASPQFLIIDSISFKGEEDARSQNLAIRLQVSTILSRTDPATLNAIVEGLKLDDIEVTTAADPGPEETPATEAPEEIDETAAPGAAS